MRLLAGTVHEIETQLKTDGSVRSFVRYFMQASTDAQNAIRNAFPADLSPRLLRFAHTCAENSVRQRALSPIGEGLASLAVASRKADPRDMIRKLSLLAHSAEKISGKFRSLFREALRYAGPEFQKQVQDFLRRDKVDRSVHEMGYKEAEDDDGFRYIRHNEF